MIFGFRSIALLPFWCLDAKGGEVALVGSRGFARVRTQACAFTISEKLVSILFGLFELFAFVLVNLCVVRLWLSW